MRLEDGVKLDYKDVLIRPKRSELKSRKDVSLTRIFKFGKHTFEGIPIMASNMDGVGTFDVADSLKSKQLFTCLVKTYTSEELINFFISDEKRKDFVAMSIGSLEKDFHKLEEVMRCVNLNYVCMDVANGYSKSFIDSVERVRKAFPDLVIIAGNVVSREMTEALIFSGADIIKCGIGSGAVCTTRIKTGVGYPQLSAVIECADAAHGLNKFVIADGGCTCPGDVAKAFAANADFVMLGGMFAGHDEGGGEIISKYYKTDELEIDPETKEYKPIITEKKYVQFYGMSSEEANKKHFGGLKSYRAAEGKSVLVSYKGKMENTVQDITGGLRSTCTYVGAINLKQLSKCATFVRCTQTHNKIFS